MLTTLESVNVLNKAEELAQLVMQSEIAEDYYRSLYRLQNDKEAQALISQFSKAKDLYEDVQRFGKYHPDHKRLTKEMREVKRNVDLHESVAAFKKAEKELQSLLDSISVEIGQAVSQYIKVPTGNPYFDSLSSCGGGCGSGGGCGCKVS
ncbi:YlbF family regulator [Bacillus lacus]|uniref:YlbF family regulator n=1 Tax=Metabacillus lacus TaxID=1983721 RepID=A0A7X2LYD8_9BACI|nr:YlbF family regulator [Metabacillus lacus]